MFDVVKQLESMNLGENPKRSTAVADLETVVGEVSLSTTGVEEVGSRPDWAAPFAWKSWDQFCPRLVLGKNLGSQVRRHAVFEHGSWGRKVVACGLRRNCCVNCWFGIGL